MSNGEELVRLDDVVIAGDRELVPVGPEIAGYVVLEAALRVRDVGGGVVSASELAIDLAGNVVLIAPPKRADDARAALSLRRLLGALLQVATSSTPALRACAKRKASTGLVGLIRELEGALIPLNRAASRRGVARIARETWELIESGELDLDEDDERLERDERDEAPAEASPSPPPVVHATREAKVAPRKPAPELPIQVTAKAAAAEIDVPSLPPPVAKVAIAPAPARAPTPPPPTALASDTASTRPTLFDDATPQTAPAQFAETGPTPTPLDKLAAVLEAEAPAHDEDPFEVVSQLPPPVAEAADQPALDDSSRGFAVSIDPEPMEAAPVSPETMRAAELAPADRTDVDGIRTGVDTDAADEPARAQKRGRRGPDRVKQLADAFQVSRQADDPTLSRALKQMVGVETGAPPQVAPRALEEAIARSERGDAEPGARATVRPGRRAPGASATTVATEGSTDDATSVQATNDGDDDASLPEVDVEHPLPRRGFGRALGTLAVIAAAAAGTFFFVKGAPFARSSEPPAAAAAGSAVVATKSTTSAIAQATGQLPATCEGTLIVDGVAEGTEVVRKLGAAPLTATLPTRTSLELIAIAEGRPPQRVRVDAGTAWTQDPSGPHLDLTIPIPSGTSARWPARPASPSPLRAGEPATRGLLRVHATPDAASVWVVVDPKAIPVPCGAASDLMLVPAGGASKALRVEWSAFTGFPAKATVKP
jgi:hypothetical protein